MKHTIEFDGYEERTELLHAVHAADYVCALEDIRHRVRGYWKHGHNFKTIEDAIECIYEHICDAIPAMD